MNRGANRPRALFAWVFSHRVVGVDANGLTKVSFGMGRFRSLNETNQCSSSQDLDLYCYLLRHFVFVISSHLLHCCFINMICAILNATSNKNNVLEMTSPVKFHSNLSFPQADLEKSVIIRMQAAISLRLEMILCRRYVVDVHATMPLIQIK